MISGTGQSVEVCEERCRGAGILTPCKCVAPLSSGLSLEPRRLAPTCSAWSHLGHATLCSLLGDAVPQESDSHNMEKEVAMVSWTCGSQTEGPYICLLSLQPLSLHPQPRLFLQHLPRRQGALAPDLWALLCFTPGFTAAGGPRGSAGIPLTHQLLAENANRAQG